MLQDRQLLKRELSQRQYNVVTAYLARTTVMVPFQALQCMLFCLVMVSSWVLCWACFHRRAWLCQSCLQGCSGCP